MKKRNKIIVSILVLFLVMAVGYAIFTQTLKINGTASANGKLDLTYECFDKEEHGGTGTCKIENDKSITTTGTLTKPTDVVMHVIKITNTGSIPVLLTDVISPNNVSNDNPSMTADEVYLDRNTFLAAGYEVFAEVNSDGEIISGHIMGDSAVENAKITIQPGKFIYINIHHLWGDASILNQTQPVLPEGGASIDYNLSFEFQQVTE